MGAAAFSATSWTVLGAAVAIAALAVVGLGREVPGFWDPCRTWGMRSGGSLELTPGDPCQGKSATSETRGLAALRLFLVDGVSLAAAGLAVAGAVRRRGLPLLVAGLLMATESVLLFLGLSIAFVVSLGAGVLFLAVGLRWRRKGRSRPAPAA
jgi:hypothetical protein